MRWWHRPTAESNSVWEGWGSVVFVIALAVIIGALIVTVLWFLRGVAISRMESDRDQAFQELTEEHTGIQEQILATQQQIAADLSQVKTRVEHIEHILREVE